MYIEKKLSFCSWSKFFSLKKKSNGFSGFLNFRSLFDFPEINGLPFNGT